MNAFPLGSISPQSFRNSCLNKSQLSNAAGIVVPSTTVARDFFSSPILFFFHCLASPETLFRVVRIRNLLFVPKRSEFMSKKISKSSKNVRASFLFPLNSGRSPMMLGNRVSAVVGGVVIVGGGSGGGDGSRLGGVGSGLGSSAFSSVSSSPNDLKKSSSCTTTVDEVVGSTKVEEVVGADVVGSWAGVGVVPTEWSLRSSG